MKSFSDIAKLYVISCKQITTTLTIIFLTLSSLKAAQVNTNPPTYKISGNVGISNTIMRGTPGNIVSSEPDGSYIIEVPYEWVGMVTPEKEGYLFKPPFKQYSNVSRDMTNQNYNAQVQLLTISDTIEIKGKRLQGVNVTANPGNIKTVTDIRGQFSIQVPYGWSGEIFLSKKGGPDIRKQYENVTTDIINGIPVPPTNVMGAISPQPNNVQFQMNRSVGRRILVVPSGDIDSEDIAETKEDILVMAEILDERFREPRLIEGVLRDFGDYFGRDNQQTEAICIQGYGLIFMMEVNYQFSSLSQPDGQVETQANSNTDQTWEQARQRLLSRGAGTQASAGEYEKQMVEILKTELIRTLKYASNIRNIKPDDWVILSVSGVNRQSMPLMGAGSFNSYSAGGEYGGGMMVGGYGYGGGSFSSYRGTTVSGGFGYGTSGSMNGTQRNTGTVSPTVSVMTIRVKKSDVDEFANDKIDLENFRQKVQILLY